MREEGVVADAVEVVSEIWRLRFAYIWVGTGGCSQWGWEFRERWYCGCFGNYGDGRCALIAVLLVRSFIPSAWTRAFMCARAACQARLWLRDIRGEFDMGNQPLTGQNYQLSRARIISAKDTMFVSSKVCTGLRFNIQSRSRHCSCTHAYNIEELS